MKTYTIILFYGALWGLVEATLGYASHYFHLHIASLLLFPIGLACMLFATKRLNFRIYVPLAVAFIATLLKLSNFAIPTEGEHIFRIINPAINIMSQGILISVAIWIFKLEYYKITFKGTSLLLIFFILYNMLLICYQSIIGTRELSYSLTPIHLGIKLSQIIYHIAWFYLCMSLAKMVIIEYSYKIKISKIETYLALPIIISAIIATLLLK